MTDVEDRIAQRKAEEARLQEGLAAAGFDGPFVFHSGDMFSGGFFGGGALRHAICLTCGSMVRLDDPQEREDGAPPIERGILLHSSWHQST